MVRAKPRLTCKHCQIEKPRSEFSQRCQGSTRVKTYCKECSQVETASRAEYKRAYDLQTKYGVSPERYNAILEEQDDSCAICKREFETNSKRHLDHDHTTNWVRGILCQECNLGLGFFRDNALVVNEAAKYLARHFLAQLPKQN